MSNRSGRKTDRMKKIEYFLLSHPDGLTQAELAERLGVHRSTITRYIPSLPGYIYIDDMDHNKWKMDTRAETVRLSLTFDEAISLYMAMRLMTDDLAAKNPHCILAMRKLGAALENLTPPINVVAMRAAEKKLDGLDGRNPYFIENLEKLTLAWARLNKVKVTIRDDGKPAETLVFCPLSFEPSEPQYTVLVHGWHDQAGVEIVLDLTQVEHVETLHESYELPEALLKSARYLRPSGGGAD